MLIPTLRISTRWRHHQRAELGVKGLDVLLQRGARATPTEFLSKIALSSHLPLLNKGGQRKKGFLLCDSGGHRRLPEA